MENTTRCEARGQPRAAGDARESRTDDHPRGYPVGRTDLKGSLARVTYRSPGMPPDLQREPDDLYQGRPRVRSSWQKHVDAKRAGEGRVGLSGLVPKPEPSLGR